MTSPPLKPHFFFVTLFIFIIFPSGAWSKTTLSEAITRAQDEQFNFQDQKALKTMTEALADFDRSTPDLENLSKLADAHLFLAFCLKNMGETEKMDQALDEAARLNPSLVPSDLLFPPSLAARFEKAKDRIWEQKRFVTLIVESKPVGARIFVNGAFKGMAPLRLDRHPDGIHYIYAVSDGKKAYKKLTLKAGTLSNIRLKLKGKKIT